MNETGGQKWPHFKDLDGLTLLNIQVNKNKLYALKVA